MKSLLLIAHGSRRAASNAEIHSLALKLHQHAGERFAHVQAAFLELAEPSIPAGIDACIEAGASEVIVMPYFLSAGRHVMSDVPALVLAKQAEHPAISIRFAAYLGASPSMPDWILQNLDSGQCLCGKTPEQCIQPQCLEL